MCYFDVFEYGVWGGEFWSGQFRRAKFGDRELRVVGLVSVLGLNDFSHSN